MEYTRQELIEICEAAFVPQAKWEDRDSSLGQLAVGRVYALLKAGCRYEIQTKENTDEGCRCVTDEDTIWIQFWVKDFTWFDWMGADEDEYPDGHNDLDYHFYLPTRKRLGDSKGGDWV